MKELTSIDIYIMIQYKYQNPIIPRLPDLITSYLLENPSKVDYYLNPNIKVTDLIKHLAKSFSKDKEMNLLEEIKLFMEG